MMKAHIYAIKHILRIFILKFELLKIQYKNRLSDYEKIKAGFIWNEPRGIWIDKKRLYDKELVDKNFKAIEDDFSNESINKNITIVDDYTKRYNG